MTVTNLGTLSVGHSPMPCTGPGAVTVFAEFRPVVRLGDFWSVHEVGDWVHGYVAGSFIPNILVEGKPICSSGSVCAPCGVVSGLGAMTVQCL